LKLTAAQQEAIECPSPCLQIAACAGSGKTEVLARRVVRYLNQGIRPDAIVAFTFTEKAAEELKARIDNRAAEADPRFASLPPSSSGLFAGTIHGYCLRLLQASGVYELHEVLTEEREWALLHRFARRLGLVDLYEEAWPGTKVTQKAAVDVFLENLSAVYNEMIPRELLAERCPAFAEAVGRYERLVDGMQLVSFDQIILRAVQGLNQDGSLRNLVQGHVTEVLVDEYQDLNRAQEGLLHALQSLGARLTVVGDDDQAIYQWRGGDVSLFTTFTERHKGTLRTLAENHRSVPSIIRASAVFARTIRERVEKDMKPVQSESGPSIEVVSASDPDGEAAAIAARIKGLLAKGHKAGDVAVLFRSVRTSATPAIEALRKEGIPASIAGKVSILDKPEMRLVAHVFVLWAGGTWRPDEEKEVVTPESLSKEMLSLTGAGKAEADAVVSRLVKMGNSLRDSGVRDLAATYMKVLSIIGLPCGPHRARQEKGLGSMSSLLVDFEHAMKRAAPADAGFLKWLNRPDLSTEQERAEEEVIRGPHEPAVAGPGAADTAPGTATTAPAAATAHAVAAGVLQPWVRALESGTVPMPPAGEVFLGRLRVFLEKFGSQAAEETAEGVEVDTEAVNLMTIHQAKGLEFPVVFVPSLVKGRFPSSKTGQPKKWYIPDRPGEPLFDKQRYEGRLDDERRLFYVAMTRAKQLLVLSTFRKHAVNPSMPSVLLQDLAKDPVASKELRKMGEVRARPASREGRRETLTVDVGQLLTYSECPRKYYLRYSCRFAPPISPALGFGRLAHHLVGEMARAALQGVKPTEQAISQTLEECFYLPFAAAMERTRMYEGLLRRMRRYVRLHGLDLARAVEVERHFEIPLDGARVRGRVDLILDASRNGQEGVEIVDIKTSEKRPPLPQHRNQLRLYAEAMSALGLVPLLLTIHDLESEDGTAIPVDNDQEELHLFKEQINRWVYGIGHGSFSPSSEEACADCDYGILCGRVS
jgi:superfamily I DNA/RNA helicase